MPTNHAFKNFALARQSQAYSNIIELHTIQLENMHVDCAICKNCIVLKEQKICNVLVGGNRLTKLSVIFIDQFDKGLVDFAQKASSHCCHLPRIIIAFLRTKKVESGEGEEDFFVLNICSAVCHNSVAPVNAGSSRSILQQPVLWRSWRL
jgi:hypothetical protein